MQKHGCKDSAISLITKYLSKNMKICQKIYIGAVFCNDCYFINLYQIDL